MVGYTPNESQIGHTGHVIAGALSGVTTRMLTQPLDVLKIRFQLQAEPINRSSTTSKYRSSLQSLVTIFKEEGSAAFWKGHTGAQLMTATYMAAEFASFEAFTKHITLNVDDANKAIIHFVSGAGAGVVATVVSYPLDIIRTRFIAQGNRRVYTSFYGAVNHIYTSNGFIGFYRGIGAALAHATPQAALHFGCYELYKQALHKVLTDDRDRRPWHAVCGAGAGVTSKLLVYPFDTGKRRLQVVGFQHARTEFGQTPQYRNLLHYLSAALKEEGIRGLYKGSSWALLKAGISTSMYFWFYETYCQFIYQYKQSCEDGES